jgi:hypothetical protein
MKKLVFAVALVSSLAFAADPAKPADAAGNPYASWKPKKVTKKDTKGIDAFYKDLEEKWTKGDIEGVAAMHDFPIYMMTDNTAGVVSSGEWNKDRFVEMMKPAFENMPKDMKMKTTPKPTFITDTIAFVEESHSMTMGKGKPETWTSMAILIHKDGKWMVKGGAEGGWGDMMGEKKTEAAPAKDPGTKTADAKPAAAPAKK